MKGDINRKPGEGVGVGVGVGGGRQGQFRVPSKLWNFPDARLGLHSAVHIAMATTQHGRKAPARPNLWAPGGRHLP